MNDLERRIKYPRTFHLPWSPGATSDDKILPSIHHFMGKRIIITEKMDGENTTVGKGYHHARSIDSTHHESRTYVASMSGELSDIIDPGIRICGENLYARHSIGYEDLPDYFLGFSVWDRERCLSWEDTLVYFDVFGIKPVPIIANIVLTDLRVLHNIWDFMNDGSSEGYVIRLSDSFSLEEFSKSVAKFVRSNHVTTDTHWMHSKVVPNKRINKFRYLFQ